MRMYCSCVDVDETLYDYATPLYKSFVSDGIEIDPPQHWNRWDYFYPGITTHEVASRHFDEVHKKQKTFKPYPDARKFLSELSEEYYIVIASHRKPERHQSLTDWLKDNRLPFDECWVGSDKTEMFHKDVFEVVIDDNPHILKAAKAKHIKRIFGLSKPWNRECSGDQRIKLFNNLSEISQPFYL